MQGMGTGFGTVSAAPWQGDSSIKEVSALFSTTPHNSLDMGALNPEQQMAAQVCGGEGKVGVVVSYELRIVLNMHAHEQTQNALTLGRLSCWCC